jgi:hypothetical protein
MFIVFNALIGVYTVFKVTGFSTDNLFAGFYGVGYTYIEMLTNFTKRLFKWFVELFDYKVVPNVPNNPTNPSWKPWSNNNPPGGPTWKWWGPKENTWYTRPMHGNEPFGNVFDIAKSQDFYKSPFNLSTSTSTDWSIKTWLWYAGVALVSVGALYLGYKFCTDPSWIDSMFNPTRGADQIPPIQPLNGAGGPPANGAGGPPTITINDIRTDVPAEEATNVVTGAFTYLTNRVNQFNRAVINSLNPFNYFTTSTQRSVELDNFLEKQYDMNMADHRFYPFTENNPYASWFSKLGVALFGESDVEKYERGLHLAYAERVIRELAVNRDLEYSTPNPVTMLGLGHRTPIDTISLWESVRTANIEHKLHSLAQTPNILPNIPVNEEIFSDVNAWKNQTNVDPLRTNIATSSKVTTEVLDAIVQAEPPIAASPIAASPIQTTTDILETVSQSGSVIEDSPLLNNREVQIFNNNND